MWSPEQGQPSLAEWALHDCPGVSGDEDMGGLGRWEWGLWWTAERTELDSRSSSFSNLLCLTPASISPSVHVMVLVGPFLLGNFDPLGGSFVALDLQLTLNSRITLWSPHP